MKGKEQEMEKREREEKTRLNNTYESLRMLWLKSCPICTIKKIILCEKFARLHAFAVYMRNRRSLWKRAILEFYSVA